MNPDMVDDRNWNEYRQGNWPEKKRYSTLKEYLTRLVADPSRKAELENWIRLYGLSKLEKILEGKK
jgi:hypothetical protein